MKRLDSKRAFTLIELIVVISVLGVLVLLATPRFMGRTQEAFETSIIHDATLIQNAAERYHIDNGEFPFVVQEYNDGELFNVEAGKPGDFEIIHKVEEFDNENESVKLYEVDFRKLDEYVKINVDEGYFLAARGNPEFGITALKPGAESTEERLGRDLVTFEDKLPPKSNELTNWEGLGPEAFDGDHDTSTRIWKDRDYFVTWDGDLTNNIVTAVLANGRSGGWRTSISMDILDKDGNRLEFINADNDESMSVFSINNHNQYEKRAFNFIMPKGAERLRFTSTYSNAHSAPGHVYEIFDYEDKQLPSQIRSVSSVNNHNSVMLNWENPNDEDFDKVAVYRDDKIVGYSSNGRFHDHPLYTNKEYKYTLQSINETGNRSEKTHYRTKTMRMGTMWRDLSPEVFDGDRGTYQYIGTNSSVSATWDGDLSGDVFTVIMSRMNSSGWTTSVTMTIHDSSGTNLNFINADTGATINQLRTRGRGTSKETFNFIMPDEAEKITFTSGGYAGSRIYIIEDYRGN